MAEDKRVYLGLKFKIGIFVVIAVILLAVFAGFRAGRMIYKDKQPEITTAYISEKINGVSELTTAEMVYSGLIIYSEGEIPLLTQKGFSMRYTANIRAGINFSDVSIKITDDKVVVEMPEAEIQSIEVDPSSIEFYDERHALFNWTDKNDVVDAMSISKEDVTAHANVDGLARKADEQAAGIIKNILAGSIGGRELVIKPL